MRAKNWVLHRRPKRWCILILSGSPWPTTEHNTSDARRCTRIHGEARIKQLDSVKVFHFTTKSNSTRCLVHPLASSIFATARLSCFFLFFVHAYQPAIIPVPDIITDITLYRSCCSLFSGTWKKPLAKKYPSLYNIVNHKNITVYNVLASNPLNIGFRRTLNGNKWDLWRHLLHRLILVQLTDIEDSFKWRLTVSSVFSVKSMYIDLLNGHTIFLKKCIWKMKVPRKIKIFMWFLYKKVIRSNKK
jgi:hypothetical protein